MNPPATCPNCGETFPTLVYLGVDYCIVCDELWVWPAIDPPASQNATQMAPRGVATENPTPGPSKRSDTPQGNVGDAGRSLIKHGRVDATPVAAADWPDAVDPGRTP